MKRIFLAFGLCTLLSCQNQTSDKVDGSVVHFSETANGNADKSDLPVIRFEEGTYDFGKIIQGEKVSHTFHFTNQGKSNLIITSAKASCGCTVAEPTRDPVKPGEKGVIDVVFDSNGKSGMINKSISVVTNCEPNTTFITITGTVITPDDSKEEK
ncbi:MAG: DUF1573 domain-containing protein [Bacteroidetes bacterium]|nr:DUF1573 domain-containing protein [Bacteroidota bacterium]